MGKAVPRGIKTRAVFLMEEFPDKFSKDFEHNKNVLEEVGAKFFKVTRNLIAGYITRKVKEKEAN